MATDTEQGTDKWVAFQLSAALSARVDHYILRTGHTRRYVFECAIAAALDMNTAGPSPPGLTQEVRAKIPADVHKRLKHFLVDTPVTQGDFVAAAVDTYLNTVEHGEGT